MNEIEKNACLRVVRYEQRKEECYDPKSKAKRANRLQGTKEDLLHAIIYIYIYSILEKV